MKSYDHKTIEDNWRDNWFKDNIYEAVDFSEKPKKYILAELPYPSGKFLHVGHMMRYTVPEIYSRFLRMRGYNVLFPMGWDCFGLPAETFAIQEGITPQEAIKTAVKSFKASLKRMGYAIDWDRELNTSDPEFYKWTQWTFKRLWEEGLADLQEMPVWWCKELGVLADEEVLPDPAGDGKVSERGGHPVERKMFKQWVLKLPEFADRLLDGLNTVDYEESVKQSQRNWIGKKEGANVSFEVDNDKVEVFTTRPDTLYGVTFLAISPDHALVEKWVKKAKNKSEIQDYIKKSQGLSELEKQTKEKTGVQIKGITAKHPFSDVGYAIPVFVADYILSSYGTGVVMGVPAHDERDYEFAQKYDLEIIEVIEHDIKDYAGPVFTGDGKMINSSIYNGMDSKKFKKEVVARLEKEGKGKKAKTYKVREQVFSRQRYWGEPIPLIHKQDGGIEAIPDNDLPLELPIMEDFLPGKDGESPLKKAKDWVSTVDSEGNPAKRETDTMPTWAGSNWYYLRYVDPHNDKEQVDMEKARYWMPVDQYFGDAGHTTVHLLYSRFWYKFLYDQGVVPHSEPYKYRMSGGLLLGPDGHKMSKSRGNTINPKDVVENYGADAVRTYLAFIGPYDSTYPWNENGLIACFRLLRSIYEMKDKVDSDLKEIDKDTETSRAYHKMVKNTTSMMEDLKMNTSVSEVMIFTNHLKTLDKIPADIWEQFIKVFAPFAPFIAEELWQDFHGYKKWNKKNSVHLSDWPEFKEKLAKDDMIEMPIQINGKVRETLNITAGATETQVKEKALESETVKKYLEGNEPKKYIFVKDRILNIVI